MNAEFNNFNRKMHKNRKNGGGRMLKSIGKMIAGFVLMLAIAAGSGYVSYLITSHMLREKMTNEIQTVPTNVSDTPMARDIQKDTQSEDTEISFEYYMVRLEGENLGIYACSDGREEFLYNEAVFVRDLSDSDLELLRGGVKLQNSSELTGFIEDFTS